MHRQDFVPMLKDHILARLRNVPASANGKHLFSQQEQNSVVLRYNRFYKHQTLRVNYTTYDVRRDSDLINPNSQHPNIMLDAEHDDDEPDGHAFWYARVLGIYHADVRDLSAPGFEFQRMEFLHVRWLDIDPDWKSGWDVRRLDRVAFAGCAETGAFGFLDPARVLRGCHLIPAFSQGTTGQLRRSPLARHPQPIDPLLAAAGPDRDWKYYYVNRWGHRFEKPYIQLTCFTALWIVICSCAT
jgi:hypothetical protein